MMRYVLFIIYLGLMTLQGVSQIKTIGLPHIQDYPKTEYNAGTQNWDICQDKHGVMYFANNDGVLQYDGENWRTYQLANNSVVRDVEIAEDGKLYASGFNEFGYFNISKKGDLDYVSLMDKLPEDYTDLQDIWRIHEMSSEIIFQSFNHIFSYKNDTVRQIAIGENFGFSFYVDDRLFVHDKNNGLKELRGNHLFLVNGGEIFRDDIEVWSMLEYGSGKLLIGTQQHGLYLYDGYEIKPFGLQASKVLSDKQIFSSEKIDSNHFAYGTIQDGIVIIKKNGEIIQHINKEKGLLNNTILHIFKDRNSQLWLALDNGINFLEINSPFTYFGDGMGIEGTGYDARLFDENIYLATNQGLFTKKWKIDSRRNYKIIPETKGQVWTLNQYNNGLLAGHNRGVYTIKNNSASEIYHNPGTWEFIRLNTPGDLLLAGTYNSLIILEQSGGAWTFRNKVKGFEESCRVLEQDSLGQIWISHGYKGIYRLQLNNTYDSVISKKFYTSQNGLPSDIDNYVYKLNGEVVFGTSKGIYKFNSDKETFVPHPYWHEIFGGNINVRFPVEAPSENIWYAVNETPHLLEKTEEGFIRNDSIFTQIKDILVGGFENIDLLGEHDVIFSAENGFVHYDPKFKTRQKPPFHTLIRHVVTTSQGDSTIFMGNRQNDRKRTVLDEDQRTQLAFQENDLRFNISAAIYKDKNFVEYQSRLEGYDEAWSEWGANNIKEYTNLPPGEYTFKARARANGISKGKIAAYHFEILPPWYRSVTAYVIYTLIALFLIGLLIYYLSNRLKRERAKMKEKQERELREKDEKYRQQAMQADQKITRLRNEKLQAELEKKKSDVELKNKEVVSTAMQITHKNEILNEIKRKLSNVSEKVNDQAKDEIHKLIKTIDSDVKMDKEWERFQRHFEDVHSDFFNNLHEKYPQLTPKDLRMCAYLRMNLSTKEIAMISNISVRGVEISRYRLRKKLNIPKEQNLVDFIMNVK